MSNTAQIYLKTPEQFDPTEFGVALAGILDATPIACLRIAMTTSDTGILGRAADTLREICHRRDVAIVIDDHFRLVEPYGLDGVHLNDSTRTIREARKFLGKEAIIGVYCGASRHAGMTAAEIGADYVCFGPLEDRGLGDGNIATADLFQWWSEMIEVPIVAEGNLTANSLQNIKNFTDFICIGPEIWTSDDPQTSLAGLVKALA